MSQAKHESTDDTLSWSTRTRARQGFEGFIADGEKHRPGPAIEAMRGEDFTFEIYQRLLKRGLATGYEFLTIREYLTAESLPEEFIVVRHDVDRKPENALEMARLESKHGVSTTHYFRTISKTFRPELLAEIERLGHEIGYHYEDMDRANGDVDSAHELFAQNLDRVRDVCGVDTVCMHGNPLTPYDNRDMWNDGSRLDAYDLLGEAYLSMDFEDVTYFSDTGRTWCDGVLKVKDRTTGPDGKEIQVNTTDELIELIEAQRVPRLCLLVHPNRWARNYPELVSETVKDGIVNVGKRTLQFVR